MQLLQLEKEFLTLDASSVMLSLRRFAIIISPIPLLRLRRMAVEI